VRVVPAAFFALTCALHTIQRSENSVTTCASSAARFVASVPTAAGKLVPSITQCSTSSPRDVRQLLAVDVEVEQPRVRARLGDAERRELRAQRALEAEVLDEPVVGGLRLVGVDAEERVHDDLAARRVAGEAPQLIVLGELQRRRRLLGQRRAHAEEAAIHVLRAERVRGERGVLGVDRGLLALDGRLARRDARRVVVPERVAVGGLVVGADRDQRGGARHVVAVEEREIDRAVRLVAVLDQRVVVIVVADAIDRRAVRDRERLARQGHRRERVLGVAIRDADRLVAQRAERALDLLLDRRLRGVVRSALRDVDVGVEVDRVLDPVDGGQVIRPVGRLGEPACRNREGGYEDEGDASEHAPARGKPRTMRRVAWLSRVSSVFGAEPFRFATSRPLSLPATPGRAPAA